MADLPLPGGNYNAWGAMLNEFLRTICINVLDHGADPTGTDDSYTAFVNASSEASSGGVILVPPGTYDLSDHIPTYSGQYWTGVGTLNATESPQASPIFNVNGKTRWVCDGLKFTGTGNTDSQQGAIYVYGSSTQVVIRNCTMDGFRKGVQMDGISDAWILNNRILNCATSHGDNSAFGIKLDDACVRCLIEGNLIDNVDETTGIGIYLQGTSGNEHLDCIIRGNVIRLTNTDGINLTYAERCIIANNVIEDAGEGGTNGRGIYLFEYSDENIVTGNHCRSCKDEGIMVSGGSSGTADRNIVTGNRCASNNHGIYLSRADDCLVEGNIVHDNTSAGIGIVNPSLRNAILDNAIRTHVNGVRLHADVDETLVQGNVITACTDGIQVDASADNNVLRRNHHSGNTANINDSGTGTKSDHLNAGNASGSGGTPAATCNDKIEVFDEDGTSLGYLAVWATIS